VKLLLVHYQRTGSLIQKALVSKTEKIQPARGVTKGKN